MSTSIVKLSTSVQELRQGFVDKIDTINTCIGIISAGDDEHQTLLQEAKQELYNITQTISELRSSISEGQAELQRGEQLLAAVRALNGRTAHMQQHLPAHLPPLHHHTAGRPKPNFVTVADCSPRRDDQPLLASAQANGNISSSDARFAYITTEEFEDVPKYVRGRLKYEQVNEMVDDLNKALTEKYALLRRPRNKLSVPDMKLVRSLRSQNNDATKGRVFVSAEDLKRWSDVRLDSSKRAVLTALRIAHKCQEIRGPASLIRYAVPNDRF